VNRVDELALWERRIAQSEAELVEVEKWSKDNFMKIPNAVMVTLIEGEVAKEMNIERYKARIEELKK
jgi:hypothetical protein